MSWKCWVRTFCEALSALTVLSCGKTALRPPSISGVGGTRDRVAEDENVGRGRVLHAARHGEFAGGGHAGLAQVRGVVHVGDRGIAGVDRSEAG